LEKQHLPVQKEALSALAKRALIDLQQLDNVEELRQDIGNMIHMMDQIQNSKAAISTRNEENDHESRRMYDIPRNVDAVPSRRGRSSSLEKEKSQHVWDSLLSSRTRGVGGHSYFVIPTTRSGSFRRSYSSSSLHSVSDDDLSVFRNLLGESHVNEDADILQPRNVDWTKHFQGNAKALLQPESPDEISEILRYCQSRNLGIVPQGGQTGLVGGGVATGGAEIILSLDRLNSIKGIHETSGILCCQAGCILQSVQDYAKDHNFLVPIDLGAKGTCQIGGNLSTNAGGQYYYRYGSLAGNVLGLQVVLADGRILDLNYSKPNIKDNTGYKLHQLFLGAEGTLGIITAVALLCPTHPSSVQAALLACDTYNQVLDTVQVAKTHLGEILGALEFMDQTVVNVLQDGGKKIPLLKNVSEGDTFSYYLLVETHGSNHVHDQEKMESFLATAMENGTVVDGVLAQDEAQRQQFWRLREAANPAFGALGYGYKYDISVPVSDWNTFCKDMQQHLDNRLPQDVVWVQGNWGHILDGNMHWNLVTPGQAHVDQRILDAVEIPLFERVLACSGSISAEHGLGQSKNQYLPLLHSEATLHAMQELKNLWDPHGILNPGKVLPQSK
jgi:FAD/FMN-containing dehydrogenase